MTDNELLLAISNMMDTKLGHITKDIQGLKEDVRGLKEDVRVLKEDVQGLKEEVREVKIRVGNVETRVGNVETRVGNIETRMKRMELTIENDIKPPLNNIQACYTSTYDRYRDNVEDYEAMKQDMSIVKKVVEEHSGKLNRLA